MPTISSEVKVFWTEDRKIKYENAMTLLIKKLEMINSMIFNETGKNIIRYKERRLKTPDSIKEKLKRKG